MRSLTQVLLLAVGIFGMAAPCLAESSTSLSSGKPELKISTSTSKHNNASLHEVIVTAAQPLALIDMPRSVTVISADDIAKSGAMSIQELLSQYANVSISSFSGNEKFTRVDFRGSGDTSVSNVLTLVDGIRINTPDLAGADFSTVSLHHIERIEIVRGANSVRFGSGASQGVINIITKKPHQSSINAKHITGSFNHQTNILSTTAASRQLSVTASRITKKDDGFRRHNTLSTEDIALLLRSAPNEQSTQFTLKHQQHSDTYQLPGPLSVNSLSRGDIDRRQGSIGKGTEGITEDSSQLLQITHDFIDNALNKHAVKKPHRLSKSNIRLNVQHRERHNLFIFGENIDLVDEASRNAIKLREITADIALTLSPKALPLTLTTGIDYHHANYRRSEGGQSKLLRKNHIGNIISRAFFIHSDYALLSDFSLSVGYRLDDSRNRYTLKTLDEDESSPNCTVISPITTVCPIADLTESRTDDKWRNEAFELGMVYSINQDSRLYVSVAKTFRKPNIDELALPVVFNDGNNQPTLSPQTAFRGETGVKYFGENIDISFGVFASNTQNEIIYRDTGQSSLSNFNFPETIKRNGIEAEFTFYPLSSIETALNLGFVDAKTPNGARIPLTSKISGTLALHWQPITPFTLSWTTHYVSGRTDGNNFDGIAQNNSSVGNQMDLPAYWLSHIRAQASLPRTPINLFLSINNLFDKHYITAAYSGQGYPGNGQAIYGGIYVNI